MIPASYELRINKNGTYKLIIRGAIQLDGLTFNEAVYRICEEEKRRMPEIKEEGKNV